MDEEKSARAALLGTVAGIGFIWMATQGVFDVYSDPVVGLPILFIALTGVFGGYLFPKKIPPLVVAIVGGDYLCSLPWKNQCGFQWSPDFMFRIRLEESSI